MSKMFVARIFAYKTPGENEGKGLYSVGMSVASRLNGSTDWVGTFNSDRPFDGRKTGFITSPQKFGQKPSEEDGGVDTVTEAEWEAARVAAEDLATRMSKKYPRGKALDAREWTWGDEIDGAPEGTCEVVYIGSGEPEKQDVGEIRELANSQAVYKGKVTQPLSV